MGAGLAGRLMGKLVKPLLIATAIAVNVIPGAGQAISGAIFGAALTGAATVGVGLTSALSFAAAVSSTALITSLGVAAALGEVQSALAPNPKVQLSALDRLSATIQPSTGRKMVFGEDVAMATDIRYVEPSGADQEYLDYIIAVAAHRVEAIKKIWLDDKLAWSAETGVQGEYAGYLTVHTVLEGNASNTITINIGSKWGSTRRLTGCAYVHLRIKRTGNSKKAESPFAGGLTSRMTIIGDGMPVYDPRLDSTVGGSGPQRATDQSTWAFNAGGNKQGSNTALQALSYQLAWRINGKVSVGIGTPPARLKFDDYIDAANECDATVTTATGSQKRYTSQAVFSETDGSQAILGALMQSCNAAMRDTGGKLGIRVRHNDLATWAVDLTDDDVLTPGTWEPVPELAEAYNVVRGRYCDPSDASLYQQVDYPEVRLASYDGQDRILPLDLPLVDDAARAQRIAKQVLQSLQYRGKFTATFGARAWNAKVGRVVRLTLSAAGWDRKLFRVESQTISMTGQCQMVLREENAANYQWDADDRAPVGAAEPTVYNPLNNPFILALGDIDDQIIAIADDGILSRNEKPAIVKEYGSILLEQAGIDARATAQGIVTQKTAYDAAITALSAYLTSLSPSYSDYDADTPIVRGTFIAKFQDVYVTRQALLNQIAKVAYDQAVLAIASAENAQDTADGKIDTYYQTSAPVGAGEGDLWFDIDDANKLYTYRSGSWVLTADTRVALAITNAAGAQATADGKVTTFYSTSTPTATALGDLWYNSSTNQLRRWNGATWVQVATIGADWATNMTNVPTELTDGRVGAGLNSDGTIKSDRVSALSVQSGSLAVRAGVQIAGTVTGSGSRTSVMSVTVVVTQPVKVLVSFFGSQNYFGSPSAIPDWDCGLSVNGGGDWIGSSGGAGVYQSVVNACNYYELPIGTFTFYARWRGGSSNVVLSQGVLTVDAAQRAG